MRRASAPASHMEKKAVYREFLKRLAQVAIFVGLLIALVVYLETRRPLMMSGLLACISLGVVFVATEQSKTFWWHQSVEAENRFGGLLAFLAACAVFLAPDSPLSLHRHPVLAAFACAGVGIYVYHRDRAATRTHLQERAPHMPRVSSLALLGEHDKAKERLRHLNALLETIDPAFVGTKLVRARAIESAESQIVALLNDASANELNYVLTNVSLALLLSKVKDSDFMLPGKALQSRSAVLELICVRRLHELEVNTRVHVLDALQKIRLTVHARAEQYVCNVLVSTAGAALRELKSAFDSRGSAYGLLQLVFRDIASAEVRGKVLQHFKTEGDQCLRRALREQQRRMNACNHQTAPSVGSSSVAMSSSLSGSDLQGDGSNVNDDSESDSEVAEKRSLLSSTQRSECVRSHRNSDISSSGIGGSLDRIATYLFSSDDSDESSHDEENSAEVDAADDGGPGVLSQRQRQRRSSLFEAPDSDGDESTSSLFSASGSGHAYPRLLRKVFSDVDDTLWCSDGKWPAGIDKRLPPHTVYAGVLEFYKELDIGATSVRSVHGEWDAASAGNLIFLSARPHVYKDVSEQLTLAKFKELRKTHGMYQQATLLSGAIASGVKSLAGDFEPLGLQKVANFSEYVQIYPEHTCVFVGDNGQGDVIAAERMTALHATQVEAVFIHRVQPDSDTPGVRAGESASEALRRWAASKIYFFDTYVGAALIAAERGLIHVNGLRRVAERAKRDLEALRAPPAASPTTASSPAKRGAAATAAAALSSISIDDSTSNTPRKAEHGAHSVAAHSLSASLWEKRRVELNTDLARANALLAERGVPIVDLLSAVCLHGVGAYVTCAPLPGVARVASFRPLENMYELEMLSISANARLFTCQLERLAPASIVGARVRSRYGDGTVFAHRAEDNIHSIRLDAGGGELHCLPRAFSLIRSAPSRAGATAATKQRAWALW